MMETPYQIARFMEAIFGVKPRRRHHGQGAIRAAVRISQHAAFQAQRVAPALPVLAEKRAELAKRRVKRWQKKHGRDLSRAPSHVKRMSREQRA